MSKRKREREILHDYMEVLARNYEKFEPAEMTGSICKLYDSLNKNRSHKCLKKLRKEVKAMRKELLEIRRFLEPFSKPIVINGSEVSKSVQKSIRDTVRATGVRTIKDKEI